MMDILRVVARFPYSAVELDELSIQEGDHLQLLQVHNDGWYLVQDVQTGHVGMVPANHVSELSIASSSPRRDSYGFDHDSELHFDLSSVLESSPQQAARSCARKNVEESNNGTELNHKSKNCGEVKDRCIHNVSVWLCRRRHREYIENIFDRFCMALQDERLLRLNHARIITRREDQRRIQMVRTAFLAWRDSDFQWFARHLEGCMANRRRRQWLYATFINWQESTSQALELHISRGQAGADLEACLEESAQGNMCFQAQSSQLPEISDQVDDQGSMTSISPPPNHPRSSIGTQLPELLESDERDACVEQPAKGNLCWEAQSTTLPETFDQSDDQGSRVSISPPNCPGTQVICDLNDFDDQTCKACVEQPAQGNLCREAQNTGLPEISDPSDDQGSGVSISPPNCPETRVICDLNDFDDQICRTQEIVDLNDQLIQLLEARTNEISHLKTCNSSFAAGLSEFQRQKEEACEVLDKCSEEVRTVGSQLCVLCEQVSQDISRMKGMANYVEQKKKLNEAVAERLGQMEQSQEAGEDMTATHGILGDMTSRILQSQAVLSVACNDEYNELRVTQAVMQLEAKMNSEAISHLRQANAELESRNHRFLCEREHSVAVLAACSTEIQAIQAQVRRSSEQKDRAIERVLMTRGSRAQKAATWRAWAEHTDEMLRQEVVADRIHQRLRSNMSLNGVSKALHGWGSYHVYLRTLQRAARVISRRWILKIVSSVWGQWHAYANFKHWAQRNEQRAVCWRQSRLCLYTFGCWSWGLEMPESGENEVNERLWRCTRLMI